VRRGTGRAPLGLRRAASSPSTADAFDHRVGMVEYGMADPLPWPDLDPIPPGWLDDTPPEAVRRLRLRTAAQRWAAIFRARATARTWAEAGERMRYPQLDDAAIAERVRARLAVTAR